MDNASDVSSAAAAGGTQALGRGAALLREIAGCNRSGIGLADLATRLALQRPTAHRILRRLVEEGLVRQDPRDRAYRLGPLVYELGLAAAPPSRVRDLCEDRLEALADFSGDVVFLIVPSGRDSVCLDRREGAYPVKALMLDIGRRRPLGAGAGSLAMLACQAPEVARSILASNAQRLKAAGEPDVDDLWQAAQVCRTTGHVLRETAEVPGISSISVAVADSYGEPLCAFSITSLRHRIESRADKLVAALRKEARLLSAQWAKNSAEPLSARASIK